MACFTNVNASENVKTVKNEVKVTNVVVSPNANLNATIHRVRVIIVFPDGTVVVVVYYYED